MRVAYDFSIAEHCGIDRYNRELLGHLPKLRGDFQAIMLSKRRQTGRHCVRVLGNFLYSRFAVGSALRAAGADLFHCTKNFTVPAHASCAIVTTVHDVIPLALSREYCASYPYAVWYRYNYDCSVRRSKFLIAISKFTGNELLRFYPECRDRIRVVPQGCDPEFGACRSPESARAAMRELGIEGPYVLSMGGAEPRKNVQQLIGAFTDAPPKHHCLVIVGDRWRGVSLRVPAGAPVRILSGLSPPARTMPPGRLPAPTRLGVSARSRPESCGPS
jgi:glycosyltransferase involved in cell wall biosynthesis